jgi:hypothetical protein
MKQIKFLTLRSFMFLFFLSFSVVLWAQENNNESTGTSESKTTTTTTKTTDIDVTSSGDAWYTQPWVWVIGAAVFILLLVALLSGSRGRDTVTSDKVTIKKTVERDSGTTDV